MMHNSQNSVPKLRSGPFPWLDTLAWASWQASRAGCSASSQDFLKLSNDAMKGFLHYQQSPCVQTPTGHLLWARGSTKVFETCPQHQESPISLLCVPSLINRGSIFQGTPQQNFMAFLEAQNIHSFWVDWGDPCPDDVRMDASNYILDRLKPAYQAVQQHTQKPVYVLGYCLGGILALGLAHHAPIEGLILMATPWDFAAYPLWVRQWASWASWITDGLGCFPGLFLQHFFQMLHGTSMLEKFKKIARQPAQNMPHFVALEDWLNDPVSLVAPVAQTIFRDWFQENKTLRGTWRVDETPVMLHTVSCPSLLVFSKNDSIVPPLVSEPLRLIPGHQVIEADVGHVGLMISSQAPNHVWHEISSWLHHKKNDAHTCTQHKPAFSL